MDKKGESKDEDTQEVEALGSQSYAGIAKEKARFVPSEVDFI